MVERHITFQTSLPWHRVVNLEQGAIDVSVTEPWSSDGYESTEFPRTCNVTTLSYEKSATLLLYSWELISDFRLSLERRRILTRPVFGCKFDRLK